MRIDFDTAGFERSLDNVLRNVEANMERVIQGTLDVAETRAKALAPVDTGKLRSLISGERQGTVGILTSQAEYSVYVEYGTSKTRAQPFMNPAFVEACEWLKSEIERGLL